MRLIRWLLSNIILIVLVLGLSYTYVYWGRLTDKDTPAGETIAWLAEEFKGVEGLLAYLKISNDTPKSETVNEAPVSATPPASVAVQTAPVVAPRSATEDRYVTPEIEQKLSRAAESSRAPEAQARSTRELWIDARKSFHRRDFTASVSSYEQLISNTQNNYDAYGELGNVYFNQGKMKQAASSYYEAAAILVRLGQVDRASSLVGMLGSMDQGKAKQLQDLLAAVRS